MGGLLFHCSTTQSLPLSDFVPHPKNPNKHDKSQIDRLAKLFQYHGVRHPIIVSKRTGYIVAGHGRLLAAKKLGMKEFPVDYQDFENADAEYAFLVADNAIADWAELDLSAINALVPELGPDFDIDWLGIKDFVIEPADKFNGDEDDVPDVGEGETRVKLGELWQLGEHRLLCGDCTVKENIERLMDGEKADMVFTDPPYGIDLETDYSSMKSEKTSFRSRKTNQFRPIEGDAVAYDPDHLFNYFDYVKEFFVWGANYYAEKLLNRNDGSWIVWDKRLTEQLDKMYGSAFELCWSKKGHKQDIARITWAGCAGHIKNIDGDNKVHPTQKPVKLAEWFFDRWGKETKLVVDVYLGSGSTLIACEKTNRKCYGMEIDPHYCDVILKRWEQFTGKQAVKIG